MQSALLGAKILSQPKWEYINPTLHPFYSASPGLSEASLCSEAKNRNLLLGLQAFELPAPSVHACPLHFALPDSSLTWPLISPVAPLCRGPVLSAILSFHTLLPLPETSPSYVANVHLFFTLPLVSLPQEAFSRYTR